MKRRVPIILLALSLLMSLFATGCTELAPLVEEASQVVEFEIIQDEETEADDAVEQEEDAWEDEEDLIDGEDLVVGDISEDDWEEAEEPDGLEILEAETTDETSAVEAGVQSEAAVEAAEESDVPAEDPMPEEVEPAENSFDESLEEVLLKEDGAYNSKEDVALYLYTYGHLPSNFITKKEAQALGWSGGSLERFAPGKSIGGSRYGNYEGLLPDKKGRTWQECDIDTKGKKSRGAKRIVWSNDGLIYYTDDHYESFELLYGNP